jgi:hypothetical protein
MTYKASAPRDGMIKNTIIIAPIIVLMLAAVSTTFTTKAYADAGSDAGIYYARLDFQSGVGFHGSCADHGIDVTQDPGYCLSFKAAYTAQWLVLVAGR